MLTSDEVLKLQEVLGDVLTHLPLRIRVRAVIAAWRRVQHTINHPTADFCSQLAHVTTGLGEWLTTEEGRLHLMLEDFGPVRDMINEATALLRAQSKALKIEIPEEDIERVVAAYLARREQETTHDPRH